MDDKVPHLDQTQESPASGQQASAAVAQLLDQDHEQFFLVRMIDGLLNIVRSVLSESLVNRSNRLLASLGLWALLAFVALVILWGVIAAIMDGSPVPLLAGIVVAVITLLLSYVAGKFCNAGDSIIKATASEMSSRAFLDCLALLLIIGALLALLVALITTVGAIAGAPQLLLVAMAHFGLAAGYAYMAGLALNPQAVNHHVRPGATAGQEFIGILSFLLKAVLKIVPILFGVLVVMGTLLFALGIILYIAADQWGRIAVGSGLLAQSGLIMFAATLPLVVYLMVIMYYLLVDLACAILRVGQSVANRA